MLSNTQCLYLAKARRELNYKVSSTILHNILGNKDRGLYEKTARCQPW